MSKTIKIVITLVVIALAALAGFTGWCWKIRDTPDSRRAARKGTTKTLRETATKTPEAVLPYLEKLVSEKSFHAWFPNDASFPWPWDLRCGMCTYVPYDFIGQLTEDAVIKFAGNGTEGSENVKGLKQLLAFSDKIMPLLSENAKSSLLDRRLDAFFLSKDYDGAIALLDKGLPSHTPGWCKGTAAKLRAHKAMDAGQKAEAVKQLLVFGEFMLSDEQKDFEECDPTTGILYSRDWVVARNFKRCADMTRDTGDAKKADEYLAEAKKYFKTALEKAKDDKKSLAELQKETKPLGL